MSLKQFIAIFAAAASLLGCSDSNPPDDPPTDPTESTFSLFVINQGNYQYGNASLSRYNPDDNSYQNEAFFRANGFKLGDMAQSMTVSGSDAWVLVNNSNVIFRIDANSCRETGRITSGIVSPRYMYRISDTKAYVSQLYDNRIAIVNPNSMTVTGYITATEIADAGLAGTEMIVKAGNYIYVNCWNYQREVLKIDPATDRIVARLDVGLQPKSMVVDRNDNLWVVTDGGWDGNPLGFGAPTLVKIKTADFSIERTFEMSLYDYAGALAINGDGSRIYFIRNDVYAMDITATALPATPVIEADGHFYNGLTVSPYDGDIYIADAIDYAQPGRVLRYSPSGTLKQSFSVGVIPGNFCWK